MDRLSRSIMSSFAVDPIQLDPGIYTRTSRIQLLYGAWVNMAQLAIGLAMGFASILIPQLSESESKISITQDDASWIGCIISGIVMDRHGRRIMLIFSQVPMFVGWLYTSLAKTPLALIIGRAITGVGCGMAMGPPRVYCTEISLPNMRGVIGSFPNMAVAIGITVQAGLGSFLNWRHLCYTCCAITLVNFCSFTLLPETPYYVLQHNSEQEARDNLAKFRGPNYDVDREMDQLRDFKEDNDFRKISFAENMGVLFTDASCKPFVLVITYVFLSQAVGNTFILYWTIDLLTAANTSFDAEIGNILLGLTRVIMSALTAVLLYRIGKRPLAIMSAIGVTLVCFVLGVFLISNASPSLVPLISLMLYMAFATLGYYTLPILMGFELYPLQVRGILGGATVSLHCFAMFASTKVKPFLMDVLGLSYTFIAFGCFSLLGIIFLYLYLPETKDLTLQEIEEYYKAIRPTLVSQRRIMSISQVGIQSRAKMSKSRISVSKSKTGLKVSEQARPSTLAVSKSKTGLGVSEKGRPSAVADKKSKTDLEISEQARPSARAKKQLSVLDTTKTRVIFEEDDLDSNRSLKSEESKRIRVLFDETADEDYPRSRKKDEKSKKQERKDDKESPKDDDEPSTSKK